MDREMLKAISDIIDQKLVPIRADIARIEKLHMESHQRLIENFDYLKYNGNEMFTNVMKIEVDQHFEYMKYTINELFTNVAKIEVDQHFEYMKYQINELFTNVIEIRKALNQHFEDQEDGKE